MPAIADQVATIEHDLAVAQTTCDSLRSENDQLKTALAALNVDHGALQAKHIDALALLDETRVHADGVASAALAMLKVSRRQIVAAPSEGTKALLNMPIPALPEIVAAVEARDEAMAADMDKTMFDESEKTDVRPELPEAEQGDTAHVLYETGDAGAPDQIKDSNGEVVLGLCKKCGRAEIELSEPCGSPAVRDYGTAADLLPKQATINAAHDITSVGVSDKPSGLRADVLIMDDIPNTDRLRAHMPGEDPLPIFLTPRRLPAEIRQGVMPANVLG